MLRFVRMLHPSLQEGQVCDPAILGDSAGRAVQRESEKKPGKQDILPSTNSIFGGTQWAMAIWRSLRKIYTWTITLWLGGEMSSDHKDCFPKNVPKSCGAVLQIEFSS